MIKKEPKKNPVDKMKLKRSKGMKDLEPDVLKVKGGGGINKGDQLPPSPGAGGGGLTRG